MHERIMQIIVELLWIRESSKLKHIVISLIIYVEIIEIIGEIC